MPVEVERARIVPQIPPAPGSETSRNKSTAETITIRPTERRMYSAFTLVSTSVPKKTPSAAQGSSINTARISTSRRVERAPLYAVPASRTMINHRTPDPPGPRQ